jgi:deoxyhypusine synthase
MKSGIEYMTFLAGWYPKTVQKELVSSKLVEESQEISNMCGSYVVPRYGNAHVPLELFCQISDSTTSYGSYSGAVPNEKIT